MYKRLIKNSAIYGILPQLPKLASFFVLPLTTPYLTGNDYGIIGVLSAYVAALTVFHLLGLNTVVVNAFYHYPKQYKWLWRQLYGFIWHWSFIYFAIVSAVIYFVIPDEAGDNKWLIIAMKFLPAMIFGPSEMLASAYYRLNQKAFPLAFRSLLSGAIGVFLNYYFIAELKLGYRGWIASEFITTCLAGILFIYPVYRNWKLTPIFNYKRRLIKKSLSVSLPVIPHFYAGYLLNSSDRVIMNRLHVNTHQIGLYSLAYNFGAYIETITGAVNQAVGPNLLELIKKNHWKEYERLIFAFESLIFIVCFTLSLWIPQWLPVLIRNKELLDIKYLLIIIIMSYSYRPMYIGCNQVLFYFEKTNVLWRITFVAGLISVVLNLIFIPIYGIIAAAVNTFISFMYMGFSGYFFKHYKELNKANLQPLLWLGIICACLPILIYFVDFGILEKFLMNLILIVLLGALSIYKNRK